MPFSTNECFTADSTTVTAMVHVNYQREAFQNYIMILLYTIIHNMTGCGISDGEKNQMCVMNANNYYLVKQNVAYLRLSLLMLKCYNFNLFLHLSA